MVDCNIHMKGCPMSEIERDVVEKMKAGSIGAFSEMVHSGIQARPLRVCRAQGENRCHQQACD